MILNDLNISNKSISFNNISLNYSSAGIHQVKGENGCGKTTLFKTIIYSKNLDVSFTSSSDQSLFKKDRYKLITYIEQEAAPFNIKVIKYIQKFNKINTEELNKLLAIFNLNESILKQNFKSLSGGERKKVQLIAGLLKNTKYVFIDEPCNNLDNESVLEFANLLSYYKDKRIIILINHNSDLEIDLASLTNISDSNIDQEIYTTSELTNFNEPNIKNGNIFNTFFRLNINTNSLTLLFIYFCLFFYISFSTVLYFKSNVQSELINDKEHISLINQNYSTQIGSDIEKYYNLAPSPDERKLITFQEIDAISKINGILDFYILDPQVYFNSISFNKPKSIDDLKYIQIPNSFSGELINTLKLASFNNTLVNENSRLPSDNKKELATSIYNLINFFGFTEEDIPNIIGKNITISPFGIKEEYTLVGLVEGDYLFISDNNSSIYSPYYKYNDSTFNMFLKKIKDYSLETGDQNLAKYPIDLFIFVEPSLEESIMLNLYKMTYSGYLYSYHSFYASNYIEQTELYPSSLLSSLTMSICITFLFLAAVIATYFANSNNICDLETYYLTKHKYRFIAFIQIIFSILLLNLLILSFLFIFNYSIWSISTNLIYLSANILLIIISYFVTLIFKL